jgi:hypothetical protein
MVTLIVDLKYLILRYSTAGKKSMRFKQLYSDSDDFVTKTRQSMSEWVFAGFTCWIAGYDHCLAPENLSYWEQE